MVKFRNVRVKMKGGKTRIQRALVLASGKLRFVKNKGTTHHTSHKTTKTKHHRSVVSSLRRRGKRGHSSKSIVSSVEKLLQPVMLLAPAAIRLKENGFTSAAATFALEDYTGIGGDGQWRPSRMVRGWGPILGFNVARIAAHKLLGILRKV